jgi:molybdate transport system regulatory protein
VITVARIRLHIHLEPSHSLGPGKAKLLELVRDLGSISAAAREMDMAYRHAWLLIDDLNRCFGGPVVETRKGGRSGGGARLTALGEKILRRFRAVERATHSVTARHIAALERMRPRR